MSRVFEKFMTRMAWVVLIVFVIRCAISWNEIVNDFSLYELFGFAGEAITVTAVIAALNALNINGSTVNFNVIGSNIFILLFVLLLIF